MDGRLHGGHRRRHPDHRPLSASGGLINKVNRSGPDCYRPVPGTGLGRNSPLPSFQRKLESSGLYNTFPLCGNDNLQAGHATRHLTIRQSLTPPAPVSWIPAFACLLQAGRNEDEERNASRQSLCALSFSNSLHSGLVCTGRPKARNSVKNQGSKIILNLLKYIYGCCL